MRPTRQKLKDGSRTVSGGTVGRPLSSRFVVAEMRWLVQRLARIPGAESLAIASSIPGGRARTGTGMLAGRDFADADASSARPSSLLPPLEWQNSGRPTTRCSGPSARSIPRAVQRRQRVSSPTGRAVSHPSVRWTTAPLAAPVQTLYFATTTEC